MNFLEQLVAEWYEYKGYFVKTNIAISLRSGGGYGGEMDVVAYDPKKGELVHIEVSGDADSWESRTKRFRKKFAIAKGSYEKEFPFENMEIHKIVIVGFSKTRKKIDIGADIQVKSFMDQFSEICEELKKTNPSSKVVPEKYSIIRAIQYTLWYGAKQHSSVR